MQISLFVVGVITLFAGEAELLVQGAGEEDWIGNYDDSIYGGTLSICVSEVDGTYYGQGLYSQVGYMRGVISDNLWVGNFYVAGIEAIRGNFSLELVDGNNLITGSYSQSPAGSIAYNVSNVRLSSSTPSDIECFKADDALLTATNDFDFTGGWREEGVPDDYPWYISVVDGSAVASYTYDDTGDAIPGTQIGPLFEHQQVCVDNWYEPGSDNGIELIVAKNDSYFYSLWWFIPAMSDFDYGAQVDDAGLHAVKFITKLDSVSTADAEEYSLQYQCYFMTNTDYEDTCLDATSDASDDDNDDDDDDKKNDDDDDGFDGTDRDLIIVALVFALLAFISSTAAVLLLLIRKNAPPMANTAGTTSSNL